MVKQGRVRRSMWLLWLSHAGFVSSEVSPGCVLWHASLLKICLKTLRGELHSRRVGQDKKRKEGNEVSLTSSGSGSLQQIKELLLDGHFRKSCNMPWVHSTKGILLLLFFFFFKHIASLTLVFNPAFHCAPSCRQLHGNGRCGICPELCYTTAWILL